MSDPSRAPRRASRAVFAAVLTVAAATRAGAQSSAESPDSAASSGDWLGLYAAFSESGPANHWPSFMSRPAPEYDFVYGA